MKMHSMMNASSRMEAAPVAPATSRTYGLEILAPSPFCVITFGSIGLGVDGSGKLREIVIVFSAVFVKLQMQIGKRIILSVLPVMMARKSEAADDV